MEEEIIIIDENTQVISTIDVVEEGVSVHQRIDFDLCGENSITIVSANSN
jgi:hypothetical protein